MALYNDIRPSTFEEMVGQENNIRSIKKLLDKKKPEQVFLFKGQTGCGKTTIARIIKQYLKISDFDYLEMNLADFRGIDTARYLLNNSALPPIDGSYKMYVIDEAHKMTTDAQNCLLKGLEDVPSHSIFVLATSEHTKMIKAIISRAKVYEFTPLTFEKTVSLIKYAQKKANVSISKNVHDIIYEKSKGKPREIVQLVEIAATVEKSKQKKFLDTCEEEETTVIELCRALFKNSNWKAISTILKSLKNNEPETIRRIVLGYARSVLLNKDSVEAAIILEAFSEPFYDSGYEKLLLACYTVFTEKKA